jgi:hypothetical protein
VLNITATDDYTGPIPKKTSDHGIEFTVESSGNYTFKTYYEETEPDEKKYFLYTDVIFVVGDEEIAKNPQAKQK